MAAEPPRDATQPPPSPPQKSAAPPGALREVAGLFLWLGATAFGGPAAHLALMEAEVVRRRRWVTHAQFLDLLGATNLIPGPNSTEMAIHLGYVRAGVAGLLVAGACFIAPAMLIVLALAWAYVRYGARPVASSALVGVKAVMVAVVLDALWNLAKKAPRGPRAAVLGVAAFALYLRGWHELLLLFGGGAAYALTHRDARPPGAVAPALLPAGWLAASAPAVVASLGLAPLFLAFLKIGATLYGSGYVLLAYLRSDFVVHAHWLTDRQLLDAVAVGQVTPGPVFTTATFVGYLLGGVPGALVATLGIFLPSFVFVAAIGPIVRRLRAWRWSSRALDGVNVASLGLLAGVSWDLARAALARGGRPEPLACALAASALVSLVRWRVNATWLLLGGAAITAVAARLG